MRILGKLCLASIVGLIVTMTPAFGNSICTNTSDCTLLLNLTNAGFSNTNTPQSGNFGTVEIAITAANTATITVKLASGFFIINTGFPGSEGFVDTLGGGLTIGNFSSPAYSGGQSDATNDLHFDGFGFSSDEAATTGPHPGDSSKVSTLSFTASKTGLNNVNQLVNFFTGGGDGTVVFAVDAFDSNTGGNLGGNTGLLGATGVVLSTPEPVSSASLLVGLGALAFAARKRKSAAK